MSNKYTLWRDRAEELLREGWERGGLDVREVAATVARHLEVQPVEVRKPRR